MSAYLSRVTWNYEIIIFAAQRKAIGFSWFVHTSLLCLKYLLVFPFMQFLFWQGKAILWAQLMSAPMSPAQTGLGWVCGSGHRAVQPPWGLWLAFSARRDYCPWHPVPMQPGRCTVLSHRGRRAGLVAAYGWRATDFLRVNALSEELSQGSGLKTTSCKSLSIWNKCSQKG